MRKIPFIKPNSKKVLKDDDVLEEDDNVREIIVEKKVGFNTFEVIALLLLAIIFGVVLGNSFDIDEDNYYVLYYDMSDENLKSSYTNMITTYEEIDTHLPIYTVDMSSTFNKKYVSDEANRDVSQVEDLMISGPTLIEFDSSRVVEYVEGKDDIQQKLNEG